MMKPFLLLVAMIAALSAGCSDASVQPGNMAEPGSAAGVAAGGLACANGPVAVQGFVRERHELKHRARIENLDRLLASTRADVIVMGDSIIQLWPQPSLRRAFGGASVLNVGLKGERVADLLFHISGRQTVIAPPALPGKLGLTNWRKQSPRIVMILIGTNDLRGKSPCYIVSGVQQIAANARRLYPRARIIVMSILPRGNPQGQFADQIAQVNAAVRHDAETKRGYEYLDAAPAITCAPGRSCDVALPKNYLHPSDKGYALLADAVRDYLGSAAKR